MNSVSDSEQTTSQPSANFALAIPAERRRVEDIVIGAIDAAGRKVDVVYFKFAAYAIYRSERRVLVQFSDDPAVAEHQIEKVSKLLSLRNELEFLTSKVNLPESYHSRIADALRRGIEGSQDEAMRAMRTALDDVLGLRLTNSRLQYFFGMATAAAIVVGLALLAFFLAGDISVPLYLCVAIAGGAIGALLSASTSAIQRKIDVGWSTNTAEAIGRVIVGCGGAAVLFLLFSSRVIGLQIGSIDFSNVKNLQIAMLMGLIGGFCERLVPQLSSSVIRKVGENLELGQVETNASLVIESESQVARAVERLEDRIAQLQINPVLDNFNGTIFIYVRTPGSSSIPPTKYLDEGTQLKTEGVALVPTDVYQLAIHFVSSESKEDTTRPDISASGFHDEVVIKGGSDSKQITFDVGVITQNIEIKPNEQQSVIFRPKGQSNPVVFEFKAPSKGQHKIFVEVYQKSRLIQVVPISIFVAAIVQS